MLIRIQFRKTNEGRFLSHLDLIHTWERVIRRTSLPLAFSQGFNPHPKINFASAAAVGMSSDGEYMDMELTRDMTLEQVREDLEQAIPPAFAITDMKVVNGKAPSLMSIIQRAKYRLLLEYVEPVSMDAVNAAIREFWNRDEIIIYRYKKNSKDKKAVNIRPNVFEIAVEEGPDDKHLWLDLTVMSGNDGNVRPEEVAYGLMDAGMPYISGVVRFHRKGLYLLDEAGNLVTPLDVV